MPRARVRRRSPRPAPRFRITPRLAALILAIAAISARTLYPQHSDVVDAVASAIGVYFGVTQSHKIWCITRQKRRARKSRAGQTEEPQGGTTCSPTLSEVDPTEAKTNAGANADANATGVKSQEGIQ